MKRRNSLLVLLIFALTITLYVWGSREWVQAAPSDTIAESADFATLNLGDPWDMSQFSDISQYINESGQRMIVSNILVEKGLFSGKSVGGVNESNNGYFFTLFPGYETAMLIGKVGHRFPIQSARFHCINLAMRVDSPWIDGKAPDQFRIYWFADDRLTNSSFGATWGIKLYYPDKGELTPFWSLYKVDLQNPPTGVYKSAWTTQPYWQGLRIDPTIYGNTNFSFDWVRLTDCKENLQTITWAPNAGLNTMWIKPESTNRNIRVATDINGASGQYTLDVQGIAPGKYTVGLSGSLSSCCSVDNVKTLTINQTPIVNFTKPSYYSGEDFATKAGNPWDFYDSTDVTAVHGMSYSIGGGIMDMVTQSRVDADPKIFLNLPYDITNSSQYQYLSFRHYAEGPWQNTPQGMIARWIWSVPGTDQSCTLVSQDIPFDVDWHTYSIDLSDPFNGQAEEVAGGCTGLPRHWLDFYRVNKVRFDPNENILGVPLHQQLDWIRLTKIDQVIRGTIFPITLGLNKPPSQIVTSKYFYTNDLNNPKQHVASQKLAIGAEDIGSLTSSESILAGTNRVMVPIILKHFVPVDLPPAANQVVYQWDTASVSPGDYYVCAELFDGVNIALYCSEAPVKVVSP